MSTGFRVDPDALDSHADRVDLLAVRVRAAAAGARPLDWAAYGLVGRVFAVAAAAAAGAGAAAVEQQSERATRLAGELRAAAAAYRQAEYGAVAGLGGPR